MVPGILSVTYDCAVCGRLAATVTLIPVELEHPRSLAVAGTAGTAVVEGFIGVMQRAVGYEEWDGLAHALLSEGAAVLHAVDDELGSFYCPDCGQCYCSDHWDKDVIFDEEFMMGWYDATMGRCPAGHLQVLDD
jgi:hypothetical protein